MIERLQWRRDDGAMLVIALIIITTVALVTGAVLSHGLTNFRTTVALRGVAGTSYAADAAAKVAVNNLRLGAKATVPDATYPSADWVYSNNVDGTGCFGRQPGGGPKSSIVLPNLYPKSGRQTADTSAFVVCTVVPGTGLFGGGGGVVITDGFARALTTFGGDFTLHDNDVMQIRGGVAVTGDLITHPGQILTDGYVKATGSCPNLSEIHSNPPAQCGLGGTFSDPVVPDPISGSDLINGTVPWRNAATQLCSGFKPGYYDDAAALTSRTTACGSGNSWAVFEPGTYYFDFHNDTSDTMHTDMMTGTSTWNITGNVVGGTTSGGAIPGRCHNPIDEPNVEGVRFIFGASSRLTVADSANVELCASSAPTGEVPVAIQQLTNGSVPTVKGPVIATATATPDTSSSTPAFTGSPTAADLATLGDGSAAWSASANGNPSASLKLAGFSPPSDIPKGSILTNAELVVTHREKASSTGSPTFKPVIVKVRVGSNSISANLPTGPLAGMTSETVPFAPNALRQILDDVVHSGELSTAATIELSLTGAKSIDLAVDAVQLKLTYYEPTLRAGDEVKLLVGAPSGSGEASEFKGDFVIQGATYARRGSVDFDVHQNAGYVAFRWGLAARQISLSGHPGVPYGYPLVSVPDEGHGLGKYVTVVDLKVFVCVESDSCTSGGHHALTVRVMITDPLYGPSGAPTPGKRKIDVLSWAEQN